MAHGRTLRSYRLFDRGYGRRIQRYVSRNVFISAVGTKATDTTAMTGTNNDIVYTAVQPGVQGNSIRTQLVDPAAANATLLVTVSGFSKDIIVSLATNGSSVITSTAAQVIAAVNQHPKAGNIVSAANAASNDGTGVVTARALTALTGGTG